MEKTSWLRVVTRLAIIGVASGVFLTAGCASLDDGAVPQAPTASASPTASATATGGVDDSIDVGETVEVTGAVVADGGMFGFEIMPDSGGEPVPVIFVGNLVVDEGDRVTVEGRMVTFDAVTLERQLGVDLDDDWVRRTTGREALVASSVRPGSSSSPR